MTAPFKMARVGGEALPLAEELISEFKAKGYRGSLAGIVEASIKIAHAHILRGYELLSPEERLKRRAYDVGTSIACTIAALTDAGVSMGECEMSYLPAVDVICVSLDAESKDIFMMPAGGADKVAIFNVATEQLRSRGYVKDDGTAIVDMDLLLGKSTENL